MTGDAAADFRSVKTELGTMSDLENLAEKRHEQGIDIIRLDAVPYIWKELGTKCRNLPKVHTLIRMIR